MTESVVFYKYKNVAFGHCHLDLNNLNHNFLGFRYKRSCNMGQEATMRIISRETESIAGNYRFGNGQFKNRVTNVVTLQTLSDSVEGLRARLHRRFLSQQFDAIFVALKLQLENRRCKPGAICRRDIAGASNMFET